MKEYDSEGIKDALVDYRPRLLWLLHDALLPQIQRLRWPNGDFMWRQGALTKEESAGRLVGIEVVLTEEQDQFDLAMLDGEGEQVILGSVPDVGPEPPIA